MPLKKAQTATSIEKPVKVKDDNQSSLPGLPPEVWTMTFANLEYLDLKLCLRVNKLFNSIITTNSSLDDAMFRGKVLPAKASIDTDEITMNPAFEMARTESSTDIEHVDFFLPKRPGEKFRHCLLKDTSAAGDHATRPGVQEISVKVQDFPAVTVKNKKGVTVLQVMKATCKIFGRKIPGYKPNADDEFFGITGIQRDSMGDHTGWTGFDSMETTKSGKLQLCAYWFDS